MFNFKIGNELKQFYGLIIYLLFLVWAVVFYFYSYPLPFLGTKFAAFILALILIYLSAGIGKKILHQFGLKTDFGEELILSIGLGLGAYSLTLFILGVTELLYPVTIGIMILGYSMISFSELRDMSQQIIQEIKKQANSQIEIKNIIFLVPVLVAVFLGLIVSFAPPTFYDSLVYHLALPQLYLQKHSIMVMPINLYTHFPANSELLYTIALVMGNDLIINLMNYFLVILTIILLAVFCEKHFHVSVARWTTILFASTPSIILLGSSSYVDIPLCFYVFVSVYCFIRWYEFNRIEQNDSWLIVAGIFSGLALGTKYTGAISVGAILVLLLFLRKWQKILVYGLSAFVVFLPWLIKNLFVVGNPVFPFLYQVFGYKSIPWAGEVARRYFGILTEYRMQSQVFVEIINFPLKLFGQPTAFGGGFDVLGDLGWIPYFLFLPALIIVKRINRTVWLLLGYAGIFFVFWFFSKQVLRFMIPLLPVLALLAGFGLNAMWEQFRKIGPVVVTSVVTMFCVSNIFLFFYVESTVQPFGVALGLESKSEYLSRKLPYYDTFQYINQNLPRKTKILFLGEQRSYGCLRDCMPSFVFVPNFYTVLANEVKDVKEFTSKLKEQNVTHILLNKPEYQRLESYHVYDFSKQGWTVQETFFQQQLKQVYAKNDVFLYEIVY